MSTSSLAPRVRAGAVPAMLLAASAVVLVYALAVFVAAVAQVDLAAFDLGAVLPVVGNVYYDMGGGAVLLALVGNVYYDMGGGAVLQVLVNVYYDMGGGAVLQV